jgi:hypothetical protein
MALKILFFLHWLIRQPPAPAVNRYSPHVKQEDRDEEHSWLTWMCVDAIIDYVDEVTETLFGYSKRIIRKEFEIRSLAKDRGIPFNASDIVKTEIEDIRFELKHGAVNFWLFLHLL